MTNISLEDVRNENIDLERIPIEEVFEQLKCNRNGLSSDEGEKRLQIFGPNKLEEKKESKFLKFLGFMWNPLSWVMECAAIMANVLANGGKTFGVKHISENLAELNSALYLQVSIISQALIFVTRSRSWSFVERPGLLLVGAFLIAQLLATIIAVYAEWDFARIHGVGWGWAGVIWIYSIITYFPLDILKFIIRYALSGKAWDNMLQNKTAFTTKKDYGKGEREAQWALAQRTLHGLQKPEALFSDTSSYRELSEIAEQAKRRAEVARMSQNV